MRAMRFRGKSYMAFALTPEPPIIDWLAKLDNWIRSSAGFFVGRPAVLDLSLVILSNPAIVHLIGELGTRIGIEGVAADRLGSKLSPLLKGGRAASIETVDSTPPPSPRQRRARSRARVCWRRRCAPDSWCPFPTAT
jgi:septum site-determining protein MinC